MKVQVAKWGNSTAVRLPKSVVKELGLSQGMALDVTVDGDAVRLAPVKADESEPRPVTLAWIVSEIQRLGPGNAPDDEVAWGADRGSEVIDDAYDPTSKNP